MRLTSEQRYLFRVSVEVRRELGVGSDGGHEAAVVLVVL